LTQPLHESSGRAVGPERASSSGEVPSGLFALAEIETLSILMSGQMMFSSLGFARSITSEVIAPRAGWRNRRRCARNSPAAGLHAELPPSLMKLDFGGLLSRSWPRLKPSRKATWFSPGFSHPALISAMVQPGPPRKVMGWPLNVALPVPPKM